MSAMPVLTPNWPAPANVCAAVTLRAGGVSQGAYASLNLGAHVGDDFARVQSNRERVQQQLSLPEMPVWLTQVHGVDVLRLDGVSVIKNPPEYDACYSNQPGKVCAVMTADCLPVLFCSRDGREVAAAHAGWRGLAAGVLKTTVENFSCQASSILAWLGPAIGPNSFEVGVDVCEQFVAQWTECSAQSVLSCFVEQANGNYLADIYALARLQLRQWGITAVYGGGEDTVADSARFYSFRRDGDTGRMATLIWRQ